MSPVAMETVERIEALSRLIEKHTEIVSQALRASLERWDIEDSSLSKKHHSYSREMLNSRFVQRNQSLANHARWAWHTESAQ